MNVEQAGTVPLDEAPLLETQPVVLLVLQPPPEDCLSMAKKPDVDSNVYELHHQIEHLADDVVYAVIEYVSPISDKNPQQQRQ